MTQAEYVVSNRAIGRALKMDPRDIEGKRRHQTQKKLDKTIVGRGQLPALAGAAAAQRGDA
jgi:hypothetical protein